MKRFLLATMLVVSTVFVVAAALHRKSTMEGQPTVARAVAPLYPPIAKQARVSSKVVVEVTIDASGKVALAKAIEGHPLLQKAAEAGAKQWLFPSGTEGRTTRLNFTYIVGDGENDKISFIPPYEVEFVSRRP